MLLLVYKVEMAEGFLRVHLFSPVIIIPLMLHTHILFITLTTVGLHFMSSVRHLLHHSSQNTSLFQVYRNEGPWPQRDAFEVLEYFRTVLRKDVFENVGGLLVK
jgi:hypothetical protein